jgi:hypothetical protein
MSAASDFERLEAFIDAARVLKHWQNTSELHEAQHARSADVIARNLAAARAAYENARTALPPEQTALRAAAAQAVRS